MRARIWYRIASATSLLFVAGHTWGFLRFVAPDQEGQRVWAQMQAVQFVVGGRMFSYGGFYRGFGLTISALELFLAGLMWWLGNRSREDCPGLRGVTWMLIALETAVLAVSARFFGIGPTALSAVIGTALIVAAATLDGKQATA